MSQVIKSSDVKHLAALINITLENSQKHMNYFLEQLHYQNELYGKAINQLKTFDEKIDKIEE